MSNPIPIPRFEDPRRAIRIAFGKLGYDNLFQTMALDLVEWSNEAVNHISRKHALKKEIVTATINNNKVPHCDHFSMIDCVERNGKSLTLQERGSCAPCVSSNCRSKCGNGSSQRFIVGECYTEFYPPIADGEEVNITYLRKPINKDGWPMIPDYMTQAVAQYNMWMLCVRETDNRAREVEARWYVLCVQARAEHNKMTQEVLEQIGMQWQ
jgi:hypothetical protein